MGRYTEMARIDLSSPSPACCGAPFVAPTARTMLASEVRHVVPQPKLATAIDCYFFGGSRLVRSRRNINREDV